MTNVFEAMEKRFSTRGYTEETLTKEEIETIVKAGLQAPTATNRQEIHITVIEKGNPILEEIEDAKNGGKAAPVNFYYNAPVVMIVSGETAFHWSSVDAGIAVENMALAAEGLGLGNVIIGCIRDALTGPKKDYFAKALHYPEGYEYKIAIAVGRRAAGKEPHTYDWESHVTIL